MKSFKKKWPVCYFIFLVISILFLGIENFDIWKSKPIDFIKMDQMYLTTLDSIWKKAEGKITLLSIGEYQCTPCDVFCKSVKIFSDNISAFYFNIQLKDDSKLLTQILKIDCYPTTYVFDHNFDLMGRIKGTYNFHQCFEDILNQKKIKSEDMMLGLCLKAVLFNQKYQKREAEELLLKSLEQGEYFYNCYFMSVLKEAEDLDRAAFYKKLALKQTSVLDSFLYQPLIHSLKLK